MLLDLQDVGLFFRLQKALMHFVNQRLEVIGRIATVEEYEATLPQDRVKVHRAFADRLDLIDAFVEENPARLAADELAIVRSWKHLRAGRFYVFRELKKYTVFLSAADNPIAYGVVALSDPFEVLIGPHLPVYVETILLPFKGRIVYDGILGGFNISFGPGVRRSLNESFRETKALHGIVTSLPISETPRPIKVRKARPAPPPPSREEQDAVLQYIVGLIDELCREHLNDGYATVCRRMAEKLARKRPSPLPYGNPKAWAAGIVRAVGGVNFLHDKTQTTYMRATDIDDYFGVSSSGAAAKVAEIRKMFKLHPLDPVWTLPSLLDDNPLAWMVEIDGAVLDLRYAPRELQEIAFRKGLIPYIPADKQTCS